MAIDQAMTLRAPAQQQAAMRKEDDLVLAGAKENM
jgi:hypothetical protein